MRCNGWRDIKTLGSLQSVALPWAVPGDSGVLVLIQQNAQRADVAKGEDARVDREDQAGDLLAVRAHEVVVANEVEVDIVIRLFVGVAGTRAKVVDDVVDVIDR